MDEHRRFTDSSEYIRLVESITKLTVIQEQQTKLLDKMNDTLIHVSNLNIKVEDLLNDRDRLCVIVKQLETRLDTVDQHVSSIKGMWKLASVLGPILVVLVSAAAWLYDKFV